MRRGKKYKQAVEWIALNDDVGDGSVEEIKGMITVLLVADVYLVKPEGVAKDIIQVLKEEGRSHE